MKREKTFERTVNDLIRKYESTFREHGYEIYNRTDYMFGDIEIYETKSKHTRHGFEEKEIKYRDVKAKIVFREFDKSGSIWTYGPTGFEETLYTIGEEWETETGGKVEMTEYEKRL